MPSLSSSLSALADLKNQRKTIRDAMNNELMADTTYASLVGKQTELNADISNFRDLYLNEHPDIRRELKELAHSIRDLRKAIDEEVAQTFGIKVEGYKIGVNFKQMSLGI